MSHPMAYESYVIVAGSRTFTDYPLLAAKLEQILQHLDPTTTAIVSGMARGADKLAVRYAADRGYPVVEMAADWATHGRSAGYRRNEAMADLATHVVVFRVGGAASRGSTHMIQIAKARGLPLRVIELP